MDRDTRREVARKIFAAAVASVLPDRLIAGAVTLEKKGLRVCDTVYPLRQGRKVHVFGSGKASVGMAGSLLSILRERTAGGVIITSQLPGDDLSPLTVARGSHPVPDESSVAGAELLIKGLSVLDEDDLFIYLLSGGSSALVEKPLPPVSLGEMQETTRLLLANGVPIGQINAVRKHLSMVKGGRLGRCARAAGAVLVISDVIGDDLSAIGSGPFASDPSTFSQCREILEHRAIWDRLPSAVRAVISAGEKGDIPETPKQEQEKISHHLVGTNRLALEGAGRCARDHSLPAHILTSFLAGEAREVARVLVSLARNISRTGEPFPPPCCLLFGGETTVTVRGSGKGGRNQELALAALAEMEPEENFLVLSGGTDGIDGNSTAAGAFADSGLLRQAADMGLSINRFLDDNNANEFFRSTGGLLETGQTGTNVMDITLIIIDKEDV